MSNNYLKNIITYFFFYIVFHIFEVFIECCFINEFYYYENLFINNIIVNLLLYFIILNIYFFINMEINSFYADTANKLLKRSKKVKSKKIVVRLIFLLLITVLVPIIVLRFNMIKNYYILNKINRLIEQYKNVTNFKEYVKGSNYECNSYYYNNIQLSKINNGSSNTIVYNDSDYFIRVFLDTKEYYKQINDNENNITLYNILNNHYSLLYDNIWNTSNNCNISMINSGGKVCYYIELDFKNELNNKVMFYIDVETGLLVRKENGYENNDNKINPNILFYDYELNNTTENEVKLIDLTDYNIIKN